MLNFLSMHMLSMRRIFVVMVTFGLFMGLMFPYVVDPFVVWEPDRKIYFRLACLAAGLAVGAFCFLLVRMTIYHNNTLLARRKAELEGAKERFASLTRRAIETRDWSVVFEDPHLPTCWRVKGCDFSDCPAHGHEHVRCWLLTGTCCDGRTQGQFAQKLGDCSACEVYREAVGQDPINEIGENFNSLMLAVHEKEGQLASAHEELQARYSELEVLHRQARKMATTDLLTGLKNHAHFQKLLRRKLNETRKKRSQLSLVMLDLDHFKEINDCHGHQKGDEVLKRVGGFLREKVTHGFAARYGGEEFILVLPGVGCDAAVELADGLRVKLRDLVRSGGLQMSASFGVADFPASARDTNGLIKAADLALLCAKRKGRNRVENFRDLSEDDLRDRRSVDLSGRGRHELLADDPGRGSRRAVS
ncbi:MAG: GGDEF domain-containing protein [Thermoleophilia bacterium]|nr:GGDEF domain-containing protein [Thermoleophilia bacterium]